MQSRWFRCVSGTSTAKAESVDGGQQWPTEAAESGGEAACAWLAAGGGGALATRRKVGRRWPPPAATLQGLVEPYGRRGAERMSVPWCARSAEPARYAASNLGMLGALRSALHVCKYRAAASQEVGGSCAALLSSWHGTGTSGHQHLPALPSGGVTTQVHACTSWLLLVTVQLPHGASGATRPIQRRGAHLPRLGASSIALAGTARPAAAAVAARLPGTCHKTASPSNVCSFTVWRRGGGACKGAAGGQGGAPPPSPLAPPALAHVGLGLEVAAAGPPLLLGAVLLGPLRRRLFQLRLLLAAGQGE